MGSEEEFVARARTVLVGNVGRLQGGIRLLPKAEPDDGQMDVAILAPRHLGHWAALAWAVLQRRSTRRDRVPRMEVLRGSRIGIVSDRVQPRELDGDVIEPGCTLTVTVRPGALRLCVAQPDRSPDLVEGTRNPVLLIWSTAWSPGRRGARSAHPGPLTCGTPGPELY